MANLIDTLRNLLAADDTAAWSDALARVAEIVDAYDALAPRPEEWPDGAEWHTIDYLGGCQWWTVEPYVEDAWYHDEVGPMLFGDAVDALPLGIDFRLCKWKRPEAQNG